LPSCETLVFPPLPPPRGEGEEREGERGGRRESKYFWNLKIRKNALSFTLCHSLSLTLFVPLSLPRYLLLFSLALSLSHPEGMAPWCTLSAARAPNMRERERERGGGKKKSVRERARERKRRREGETGQ